jgi:hypothetical protein
MFYSNGKEGGDWLSLVAQIDSISCFQWFPCLALPCLALPCLALPMTVFKGCLKKKCNGNSKGKK